MEDSIWNTTFGVGSKPPASSGPPMMIFYQLVDTQPVHYDRRCSDPISLSPVRCLGSLLSPFCCEHETSQPILYGGLIRGPNNARHANKTQVSISLKPRKKDLINCHTLKNIKRFIVAFECNGQISRHINNDLYETVNHCCRPLYL